jgi:hypothetical protein
MYCIRAGAVVGTVMLPINFSTPGLEELAVLDVRNRQQCVTFEVTQMC